MLKFKRTKISSLLILLWTCSLFGHYLCSSLRLFISRINFKMNEKSSGDWRMKKSWTETRISIESLPFKSIVCYLFLSSLFISFSSIWNSTQNMDVFMFRFFLSALLPTHKCHVNFRLSEKIGCDFLRFCSCFCACAFILVSSTDRRAKYFIFYASEYFCHAKINVCGHNSFRRHVADNFDFVTPLSLFPAKFSFNQISPSKNANERDSERERARDNCSRLIIITFPAHCTAAVSAIRWKIKCNELACIRMIYLDCLLLDARK